MAGLIGTLITVTDGDTIRLDGQPCRLVPFDTPETHYARCMNELRRGIEAKRWVQEFVNQGVTVEVVGPNCKFRRKCCVMTLNGRNVGEILIEQKLAVYYNGRGPRKNWCR